jgi:hypothetical protein
MTYTTQMVRLTVSPEKAHVVPGDRLDLALIVEHAGAVAARYHVDVTGLQQEWYDLCTTRLTLAPGATGRVELAVHPWARTVHATGRYPFKVQVTSEDDPTIQASTIVDLAVGVGGAPGVALMPRAETERHDAGPITTPSPGAHTGRAAWRRPLVWLTVAALCLLALALLRRFVPWAVAPPATVSGARPAPAPRRANGAVVRWTKRDGRLVAHGRTGQAGPRPTVTPRPRSRANTIQVRWPAPKGAWHRTAPAGAEGAPGHGP